MLPPPALPAGARSAEIVGKLTYHMFRRATPDSEATVIVFPEKTLPRKQIDAAELLPPRPAPGDRHPALLAIKDMGGAYARAGHDDHT